MEEESTWRELKVRFVKVYLTTFHHEGEGANEVGVLVINKSLEDVLLIESLLCFGKFLFFWVCKEVNVWVERVLYTWNKRIEIPLDHVVKPRHMGRVGRLECTSLSADCIDFVLQTKMAPADFFYLVATVAENMRAGQKSDTVDIVLGGGYDLSSMDHFCMIRMFSCKIPEPAELINIMLIVLARANYGVVLQLLHVDFFMHEVSRTRGAIFVVLELHLDLRGLGESGSLFETLQNIRCDARRGERILGNLTNATPESGGVVDLESLLTVCDAFIAGQVLA